MAKWNSLREMWRGVDPRNFYVCPNTDIGNKVKVKVTPEQAKKAQRGSTGIAQLFL